MSREIRLKATKKEQDEGESIVDVFVRYEYGGYVITDEFGSDVFLSPSQALSLAKKIIKDNTGISIRPQKKSK